MGIQMSPKNYFVKVRGMFVSSDSSTDSESYLLIFQKLINSFAG